MSSSKRLSISSESGRVSTANMGRGVSPLVTTPNTWNKGGVSHSMQVMKMNDVEETPLLLDQSNEKCWYPEQRG